jgi:hypothetical protein
LMVQTFSTWYGQSQWVIRCCWVRLSIGGPAAAVLDESKKARLTE